MITVGSYLWTPDEGSKFAVPYGIEDVRRLQRMVADNTTVAHQFVVVTDRPELFENEPDIRAIEIDKTTHVPGTCYVRLMTFHPEGREIFGDRFVQIDLDTLIVGNIDHILHREEDLVLWRNPARHPSRLGRSIYNTSLLSHRCGSIPALWQAFVNLGKANIPAKDDQWYLSDALGEDVPYFDGKHSGVYRIARIDTPGSGVWGELPANACIVTFPGSHGKPGTPEIMDGNPWLSQVLGNASGGWVSA